MKKAFTTVELVMMAMFTAILCASAYLSIPTPLPNAAHITLQRIPPPPPRSNYDTTL